MTHVALEDDLLDAQTLRAIGSSPYGGADVGECLATAGRIHGTDLSSWHDAWTSTALATLAIAEREADAGRTVSARLAFWRASSYFRTAGVMLMAPGPDPRLAASNARQTETFRRGAALLATPPEIVALPYEDTTLPGYFFRVDAHPTPRATVLLVGGYDGTAEELYFFNGAAALARGYNVLAFDGPGQGAALLQQGLLLRPDWENVVTPVLDHALSRPDVDPRRVALIGLSLGGYLAPRAASAEHRIAACIADSGSYDMFQAAVDRMPGPIANGFRRGRTVETAIVRRVLGALEAKPTAGWALRRGQLVHGVDGPVEYLRALRDYTLVGLAGKITCPTLVCNAEGDDIAASAPQLHAALNCEKQLLTFTAAEGAGDHCEAGARLLYHARSFGWLDRLLHPEPPRRNPE